MKLSDNIHHVIVIGDGAEAKESYELVVKIGCFEGRTLMTKEEHEFLSSVFNRINFRIVK